VQFVRHRSQKMFTRFKVAGMVCAFVASIILASIAQASVSKSAGMKGGSTSTQQLPYGWDPDTWSPFPDDDQEPPGRDPNSWSPFPLDDQEPYGRNPNSWSPYYDEFGRPIDSGDMVWIPDQIVNGVFVPGHMANRPSGGGIITDGNWQVVPNNNQWSQNWNNQNFPGNVTPRQDEMFMRDYSYLGIRAVFQSNMAPTVNDVFPNTPAQTGGLIAGDKLVSVNGRSLVGANSDLLSDSSMDLKLRVLRGNQLMKVVVPAKKSAEFGYFSDVRLGVLGSNNGLKVVSSNGQSGLQVGDMITAAGQPNAGQQRVRTPMDLANVAQSSRGNVQVTLSRGNHNVYVMLRPDNLRAMTGSPMLDVGSFGFSLENVFEFYGVLNVMAGSRAAELGFEPGDQIIRLNNKTPGQISNLQGEFDNFQSAVIRRANREMRIGSGGTEIVGGNISFQFANLTNKAILLIWKNETGGIVQEKTYQTVQPNQIAFQNTRYGHKWLMRDSQNNRVLKEFSATIDGQGIVLADSASVKTFNGLGVIGRVVQNRSFLVGQVMQNSRAADMGLLMGDQIVSINDMPVNEISDDQNLTNGEFQVSVRLHGQGQPQRLTSTNGGGTDPVQPDTGDFIAPDWVMNSNPGVPGGITVTTPGANNPPAIADVASFYIKNQSGQPLELVRVHHFGTQVVSGSKQYLVCEMRNRGSGERSFWNVEIYIPAGQQIPGPDGVVVNQLN
jgi:C-terminal processing protease CtpA/Prc